MLKTYCYTVTPTLFPLLSDVKTVSFCLQTV